MKAHETRTGIPWAFINYFNFDIHVFSNAYIIFPISWQSANAFSICFLSRYPIRTQIKSCVSNSARDPCAMERKWMKLLTDCLACPSAMFEGMDIAARLI